MKPLFLTLAALTLTACATNSVPVLSDFSEDRAEVMVPFSEHFGRASLNAEEAQQAANPVAEDHCGSVDKNTAYVSLRQVREGMNNLGTTYGHYVVLYRCEGATQVTPE